MRETEGEVDQGGDEGQTRATMEVLTGNSPMQWRGRSST